MRYLIGNWKSNQTVTQTQLWLDQFASLKPQIATRLIAIISVPFTDISEANRLINHYNLNLLVAAQDVSPFLEGKHTGEITAGMLSELTRYCLVGHSERRQEFKETSDVVAQKTARLLESNITPVVCLDTPYLEEQIKLLLKISLPIERCIFVYEPLAAIGTNQPADPFEVEMVTQKISFLTQSSCPILYGGSVTPQNITSYTSRHHVDGVLVGGESLKASTFLSLIENLTYEL